MVIAIQSKDQHKKISCHYGVNNDHYSRASQSITNHISQTAGGQRITMNYSIDNVGNSTIMQS